MKSVSKLHSSRNPLPTITYPAELPFSQVIDELRLAIEQHPVVIVCGATGSGKTTQLPKLCLELGRGKKRMIAHTQPRRLAAITVAQRIASELSSELGVLVGYQVRFAEQLQSGAWIKIMTDGVLLAQIQSDPDLKQYDTLIIDEAHERSLNIDFLLAYIKQLIIRRTDLKVIITSATIDADRFAHYFSNHQTPVPIITVEGRTYPVEIRYIPKLDDKIEWTEHLCTVVDSLVLDAHKQTGRTDILVFLSGEQAIKEAMLALRKHYQTATIQPDILPLFSRLSIHEQKTVFNIHSADKRRIILATNVAETSVTVPGIRYVIDTGTARIKRYSVRSKIEQLLIEPISQAAANQRAGRCGRIAPGICIRLYEELDFNRRPKFTDPEILRSSLAAVILRIKSLQFTAIETLSLIDMPKYKAIADGYHTLYELGAIHNDTQKSLTDLGKQLSQLPIDPRLGRMVLSGEKLGVLHAVLIIVAALSVADPRDKPKDKTMQINLIHQLFVDEKSEFIGILKLWSWYEKNRSQLSTNKLFTLCKAHYLNPIRMREWANVYTQLLDMSLAMHLTINDKPAEYTVLHTALLSGLLGNIGFKPAQESLWNGCRGIKFLPHPNTHLAKKPSSWIMAASLVETTRLYARTVAAIEPTMIEQVAKHIMQYSYSDPQWNRKQAQTIALERATLYGLPIYQGRKVSYASINSELAREIMIRSALVEQNMDCTLPFFLENKKLIKAIEQLEHQSRRPDLMVDDDLLYAFYDAYIPKDICSGAGLHTWWQSAVKDHPNLLYLTKEALLKRHITEISIDTYPKTLHIMGQDLKLEYRFEVGSLRDGVTVSVPLMVLNQMDAQVCEWLVLGMLKDKVQHLLKTLPPKIRHRCQPFADTSTLFIDWANQNNYYRRISLLKALVEFIRYHIKAMVHIEDFKPDLLPAHCYMNYQIIDDHGRILELSRNLAYLKTQLGSDARDQFVCAIKTATLSDISKSNTGSVSVSNPNKVFNRLTIDTTQRMFNWNIDSLPELLEITQGNQTLFGFPALKDEGDSVSLSVFDDEQTAKQNHHLGIRRLLIIQLKDLLKFLKKSLHNLHTSAIQAAACQLPIDSAEYLVETVIHSVLDSLINHHDTLPKTAKEFDELLIKARAKINLLVQEWAKRIIQIITCASMVYKKMMAIKPYTLNYSHVLIQYQRLFHRNFLSESFDRLGHYPRYLQGMLLRIDKIPIDPLKDERLILELKPLWLRYERLQSNRQLIDENISNIRWLLEELHISLFAQPLKTAMPVSIKRINKAFEHILL